MGLHDEVTRPQRTSPGFAKSTISSRRWARKLENSTVVIFKTEEPITVYRVYSSDPNISRFGPSGSFLSQDKPISQRQVLADSALGNDNGAFLQYPAGHPKAGQPAYDRYVEIEIPAGEYIYLGYAGKQTDEFPGGGSQIVIDDVTRDKMKWNEAIPQVLPEN